jgi:hypothetical protein
MGIFTLEETLVVELLVLCWLEESGFAAGGDMIKR